MKRGNLLGVESGEGESGGWATSADVEQCGSESIAATRSGRIQAVQTRWTISEIFKRSKKVSGGLERGSECALLPIHPL